MNHSDERHKVKLYYNIFNKNIIIYESDVCFKNEHFLLRVICIYGAFMSIASKTIFAKLVRAIIVRGIRNIKRAESYRIY